MVLGWLLIVTLRIGWIGEGIGQGENGQIDWPVEFVYDGNSIVLESEGLSRRLELDLAIRPRGRPRKVEANGKDSSDAVVCDPMALGNIDRYDRS